TAFRNAFYFVSTYANAPIPTKQRLYAFWGLPALAFALHGWQRQSENYPAFITWHSTSQVLLMRSLLWRK
ncbi:MAG: hypothetical protein V3U87_16395, partial [Methylococcaceae bacterium]